MIGVEVAVAAVEDDTGAAAFDNDAFSRFRGSC